jgi:glycolate oxidase iron-sulfur subunit
MNPQFDLDEIMNCMRCGFCLPACPTYRATGNEAASPRGRIAMMKGIATGDLSLTTDIAEQMYFCLGCRACESACPAGVQYGHLIESARDIIEATKSPSQRSVQEDVVRTIVYKKLFLDPARLENISTFLWLAQVLGVQKFADATGLMRILPKPMAAMQKAVGRVASPMRRKKRPSIMPSQLSTVKYRVGMFKGCVMDALYFETNQKTMNILSKVGCVVSLVEDQACCGALHAHSGENWGAIDLAKRNIEAFEKADVDLIVNNAGGCGAALKEYAHWLQDDPEWAARAIVFVNKVRDISELLVELSPLPFTKNLPYTVTYQDSCHLRNGQGIWKEPRELIRQIPGIKLVEMNHPDHCCGSAGIYNITNFDMSMQLLDDKMDDVVTTEAKIIVTTNPGCLLQMNAGIKRAGLEHEMEALHIIDLLDRGL